MISAVDSRKTEFVREMMEQYKDKESEDLELVFLA